MLVINLGDGSIDIIGLPAELVQDEGRRFVELDGARQREDHVLRAHRVTGGELPVGERKGQALAVAASFPRRCKCRLDLGAVVAVRLYETLIEIVEGLNGGELETFGRVKANADTAPARVRSIYLAERGSTSKSVKTHPTVATF